MSERYEIRLSGFGGQGIITAGIILAEAAGVYDGKFVTQTQSYGPEARGGASRCDVVISDEEIDYPKADKLDLLVALNQESYETYRHELKDGGVLVVDSTQVEPRQRPRLYKYPVTKIARDEVGSAMTTNIVTLGIVCALTGLVSKEAIEKAVLARVPKGTEEMNVKALRAGFNAVGDVEPVVKLVAKATTKRAEIKESFDL